MGRMKKKRFGKVTTGSTNSAHMLGSEKVKTKSIDIGNVWDSIRAQLNNEFRVQVRRPDDLLVFDLIFVNLQLTSDRPPKLIKQNADAPAYFIAEFPPQSFGEEVFPQANAEFENSANDAITDEEKKAEPDRHIIDIPVLVPLPRLGESCIRMAGRSRVALSMPVSQTELSYTLAGPSGVRSIP